MKLGANQRGVLDGLLIHGEWSPTRHSWVWDAPRNTERILESLVRHGLVVKREVAVQRRMRSVGGSRRWTEEWTVYKLTALGRRTARSL